MIKMLSDPSEIYFLLEKTGRLFDDFSSDHVLGFDRDDDFYVVLYTAKDRKFTCFIAESVLQDNDTFPLLMEKLQDECPDACRETALKIVEHRMHSKNNSGFYFDAH
jgi:hypothetical protein